MISLSQFWKSFWHMSKAALACMCRREENGTNAAPFLSGVSPRDACRKEESAGSGVLSSGENHGSVFRTYMIFSSPRHRMSGAALYDLRGRSLVEMLGVLAIIGVLSIGAISGYQKAMLKYRLNKQSQQFTTLLNNALLYQGEFKKGSYISIVNYLFQLNAIPLEMVKNPGSTSSPIYDAMNNKISIHYHEASPAGFYSITTQMNDDNYSMISCRNIVNTIKANSADLWQINVYKNNGANIDGRTFGDKYCVKSNCIRNMSLIDIDNFCRNCQQKDCTLGILYGYGA